MKVSIRKQLFAGIFFVTVLILLNILFMALRGFSIQDEKNRYRYMAVNEANYVVSCVDKVVVRTYTLREMLIENQGKSDFFDLMAEHIYQTVIDDAGVTLKNIAVAPSGKVLRVFPYAGNESLVGFDFMDASRPGNLEAIEAYRKEKTIVTNPFNLVQGGVGMAARTPVFIRNGNERKLWGLVTATMDFSDLLKVFNFDRFSSMKINYRLWYTGEGGQKVILASNAEDFGDAVSQNFTLFNLKWNLDLIPENGWYNANMSIFARFVVFVISILLTLLMLMIFRIQEDGQMMKNYAEQDGLTKCYSRYYLNSSLLDVNTGDWKDKSRKYSLVIIDVDKFKQINDNYGHNTGDRALIAISQVLKDSVLARKGDCIIRFGGDEFLLFINEVPRKELKIILQSILSGVEGISFEDVPELHLSVSIGGALYEEGKSNSYNQMMKEADEKLYQVKENGRNDYLV